jgi:hypothetical protein
MNGKRTTKKVCKDGVQERLARIQEAKEQDQESSEEYFEEDEVDALFEGLYTFFVQGQPWGS